MPRQRSGGRKTAGASPAATAVAPPPEETTDGEGQPQENPRTVRSREKLEEAQALILEELKDGNWHSSNEIHKKYQGQISEGMYGRVKSALGIQHRRVKDGDRVEYQWKLPEKEPAAS